MAKTVIVAGYGTGISKAVAEKFGAEGFSVALVARNADRLAKGVTELQGKGIKAAAFTADLGDPRQRRPGDDTGLQRRSEVWDLYSARTETTAKIS